LITEQPPPPKPYASSTVAALVAEYAGCVGMGAWGQAQGCLERLVAQAADGADERPRALAEMAAALLSSLPGRGWRLTVTGAAAGAAEEEGNGSGRRALRLVGHGGASASPERLEAEVLAPLRAAALAILPACVVAVAGEAAAAAEEEEEEEGGRVGAPLLLALRLEAAVAAAAAAVVAAAAAPAAAAGTATVDATEAAAAKWAERAARAVAAQPGLVSLHCCGLALALERAGLPTDSTEAGEAGTLVAAADGGGGGGPASPRSAAAVDCLLAILALSLPPSLEVEGAMRGLAAAAGTARAEAGSEAGGGEEECSLPPWDVDEQPYRILPPTLAARTRWVGKTRYMCTCWMHGGLGIGGGATAISMHAD
jgi:hypothetical protein